MAITIIVTNAGRAALVNAASTGTNAVTVTQLGITEAVFVPDAAQIALPGEIKRIALASGVVVADDQIHVTASDVTTDAYAMRGFGLYLADGTLFAIYGQAGAILNKTSESMMLLAIDIAFADIDAEMIEFGDTNFILPPATTEILGLVELATTAEAQAGSDAARVLTPLTGKQSVLGWLLSQDGSGSGLDADMLDGLHASAFATAGHTHDRAALTGFGTMAGQNAHAVDIDGGAIDGTPIGAVNAAAGRFTNVLATGGSSGFGALAPKGRVQISAGASSDTPVAGTVGNGVGLFITNNDPGYGLAFGIAGTGQAWIQSQRSDATGALYDILLNPIGGNVGIGTTAPGQKLDVRGASGVALQIANSGDASRGGKISVTGAAGAGAVAITTTSSGYALTFGVDGAEMMRLAPSGNFGIGTGADAAYLLEVAAPAAGGGALQTAMQIKSKSDAANNAVEMRFAPLIAGQSRTAIGARREGAANSAALFFATGGAERLTLDGTGHLVPGSDGQQILGWPTARFKEGHFSDFVRVGGNNAWHAGNDGSGSGLDADMLDGLNSSAFLQLANFIGSEILSRLVTVDGSGSGLDADLLDGYHASSFDRVVDQNLTDDGGYIVYASGRKECWGRVVAGMDSYATWNLPIAHTSWCHPSFTYTGKIGVNNTGDNTMFAGFLGAPPYALRFWNAEDTTLTIYVRTIGV